MKVWPSWFSAQRILLAFSDQEPENVSMRMRPVFIPCLLLLALLGSSLVLRSQNAKEETITPVSDSVRTAFELSPFYKKQLLIEGFPVISSEKVSDFAFLETRYIVSSMLAGRADILASLVRQKIRLAIMAPDEFTTDIPEHSDLTPSDWWDRRARGLGPTKARPCVSCGEENLLQYAGDHYAKENILVHEFAHAIHEGLKGIDETFDDRLTILYEKAIGRGLWKDVYASTNRHEYWAEGVQSYFGNNRENDHSHNHVNTREELREYDPALFALIHETFRENPWQYQFPKERDEPAHLAGYEASGAASFSWPAHLEKIDITKTPRKPEPASAPAVVKKIEGWNVHVSKSLLKGENKALGRKALRIMRHQLYKITLLMPKDRLKKLRRVPIWLEENNPTLKGIQYHPSREWLINNGHDPRVTQAVHIPQAKHLVSDGLISVQPWVMLHELAHAYHDRILDFDEPRIIAAFEKARDRGHYDKVLHIKGREVRHYALTNHKEYFAEATEAYFGTNDFYPYVRSELKAHDPEAHALLAEIWGRRF
ncbi:MAG: hypothetical protein AAF514_11130 [Verrucomicrobiota bacterium]